MSEEHRLARTAVHQDLFGPEALEVDDSLLVPDKYTLVRRLGEGGVGVVHLATDTTLGRPVALKFLRESSGAVLERFRREARYAARLDSPAIVKVFEMDEFEGRPYIAMEYIDGGNLAQAELEPRELVRRLLDVVGALHHAHENGIVHRDIKPENILLSRSGQAYVTDFGIARSVFGGSEMTLSHEGQVMGTPASMPPEQARGEVHAVDARSDVYSLGATMFRQLTGRWPFTGDHVVDVLHAVIHEEAPLLRSFAPDLPRGLEAIVLKCLQKQPRDRYASMQELAGEFEQFLNGGNPSSESKMWFRKLVKKLGRPVPEPMPDPEPPEDAYLTLGMEVSRELAMWDADLYRVSRNLDRSYPRLEKIIEHLGRFLEERPDAAWARFYRGMALCRRGRHEAAVEEMEQAINRVSDLPGAHFELGRAYLATHLRHQREARKHISRMGVVEHLKPLRGRLEQAALAFQDARRMHKELSHWQLRYADAVGRLADDRFAECVAICDEILEEDPDAAEVWKLRGDAVRLAGDDPIPSYRRALEIRRSYYEVCILIAEVLAERGDFEGAREAIAQAQQILPHCLATSAFLGQLSLMEARHHEDSSYLEAGLAFLDVFVAENPEDYEGAVTRAELLLEKGTRNADRDTLQAAWDQLQTSHELEGCQNRVQLLEARTRLQRAHHDVQQGRDASADLDAILAFRNHEIMKVPDAEPWQEVVAAAQALKDRVQ